MANPAVLTITEPTLADIAPEWRALLDDTSMSSVFLGPAWLRAWLHVFGDPAALRLLAVREGERLTGVAAFRAEDDRLLLAGDPATWDYAGIAIASGHERDVLHTLLGHLAAEPWREVVLWGLEDGSAMLRELPAAAEAHGYRIEFEDEAVCPTLELPASWDEYMDSLPKKHRHELRRKMRRFAESGDDGGEGAVVALTSPADVAAALPEFIRLHVESREDKAEFMTPQMEHFFRHITDDLAAEGALRLYFLERDGHRLASILCLDTDDSLLLYNSGYDPAYAHASAGLVSKALCLREAIDAGKRRINFLRGTERYKYELGAEDQRVVRCRLTRAPA